MKKLMQKSQTRQELLDNTVRHFNSTNRSLRNDASNVCLYRSEDGYGCAIGREISDELAEKLNLVSFGSVINTFSELPPRLRRFGMKFLCDVQILHDVLGYWDKSGLSYLGREAVKEICEEYQLKNPALISDQN